MPETIDFLFRDHGSIWTVLPQNEAAKDHLLESVSEEAQWFGEALAVEARYVATLAEGLKDNGFTVGR